MKYTVNMKQNINKAAGLVYKDEGLEEITLTIYSTY